MRSNLSFSRNRILDAPKRSRFAKKRAFTHLRGRAATSSPIWIFTHLGADGTSRANLERYSPPSTLGGSPCSPESSGSRVARATLGTSRFNGFGHYVANATTAAGRAKSAASCLPGPRGRRCPARFHFRRSGIWAPFSKVRRNCPSGSSPQKRRHLFRCHCGSLGCPVMPSARSRGNMLTLWTLRNSRRGRHWLAD